MSKYIHSTTVERQFPNSPTNSADLIVAVMNRNNTGKVIGNHITGGGHTFMLHISKDAMSKILGRDIGHTHTKAMLNPANEEYFNKVQMILELKGFSIYPGKHGWVVVRGANAGGVGFHESHSFGIDDLTSFITNEEILKKRVNV